MWRFSGIKSVSFQRKDNKLGSENSWWLADRDIQSKIELKSFLSVHETTNGEPECEELCRNDEKCVGFNYIRSKCFLKSSLGTELKLKMSISGKKFKPDYNGDPLKGIVEQNLNKIEAEFKIKGHNLVYSILKKSICVKSISKQSNAMSHHHVTMLKSGIHDLQGTLKTLDEESDTSSMKSPILLQWRVFKVPMVPIMLVIF